MKKLFSGLLSAVVSAITKTMRKGYKWLYDGLTKFLQHPLDNTIKWLKNIAIGSITITAWFEIFEQFGKKILGYLAILTGVSSGALSAKQIFDFGNAVLHPQEQMLDWLAETFASLPSIQSMIESIDSWMRSFTAPFFTPPVTFTYLLQVTAIGECFNQYLQALISTLIFVFSMFVIRWAFSNNFTFTREVPKA